MNAGSVLARAEYEAYLIRLAFGAGADVRVTCIERAYQGIGRTLRGIQAIGQKDALHADAVALIAEALDGLRRGREAAGAAAFDGWHRHACQGLRRLYGVYGYESFSVGQAQAWLNKTLEYLFAIGETHLPGYARYYPHSHLILDSETLPRLHDRGMAELLVPWSRLDDYDAYLECQQWIRRRFVFAPLDVAVLWGLGKDLETWSAM
jgi:hypothetical protein